MEHGITIRCTKFFGHFFRKRKDFFSAFRVNFLQRIPALFHFQRNQDEDNEDGEIYEPAKNR